MIAPRSLKNYFITSKSLLDFFFCYEPLLHFLAWRSFTFCFCFVLDIDIVLYGPFIIHNLTAQHITLLLYIHSQLRLFIMIQSHMTGLDVHISYARLLWENYCLRHTRIVCTFGFFSFYHLCTLEVKKITQRKNINPFQFMEPLECIQGIIKSTQMLSRKQSGHAIFNVKAIKLITGSVIAWQFTFI